MYEIDVILYGNISERELAESLLLNLSEVKRESSSKEHRALRLLLSEPIKETSLISMLHQSGIHGFRLVEIKNQRSSRNASPLSL